MDRDVLVTDAERICARVSVDGLSGARVLVTGASGLVGTCFLGCLAVLKRRGLDLDVYAQTFSEPPPHIVALAEGTKATIIHADLADFDSYARLPEADIIVHAAGYAQPLRFMANPGSTLQIGATATLALLQRVRPGGHFLFLSSAQVYTGLDGVVCTESTVGTTTPAHPRASYIEGKRAGEAACHAFRQAGVHATVARLGDVYGPGTRAHDKRALNTFIEQAITRGEVRLADAGAAVRTYAYVADAVERLWNILLRGSETVYNVGGHQVTTVLELAGVIGRLTGTLVVPGPHGTGVAGAPQSLRMDLTRVDAEFGVQEEVGLEAGLAATIAWQRRLYQS